MRADAAWWSPVTLAQHALESMHSVAGLPWWAALLVLGTSVRVATAPLVVAQTKASVRMALARPHIERHSQRAAPRSIEASMPHHPADTQARPGPLRSLIRHPTSWSIDEQGPSARGRRCSRPG